VRDIAVTATTFSLPSARMTTAKTTELSTPPENETMIGFPTVLNHSISLSIFSLTHLQVLNVQSVSLWVP
jgi:hypothetical protein